MPRAYERDLELEDLNAGPPPEVWETCPDCGGEGYIEKPRPFADDPYYAVCITCETCNGAGGFICEAS